MKLRIYIAIVILGCTHFLVAQVGIGTTNPNAVLDIRSSNQTTPANNDGILIPKIDAFPATNPTAAQQGMLVYLNVAVGLKLPGFYYWDNPTTSWIGISNSAWQTTGNSGTSPASNFFGTTDNQDIVIKRFGVRGGYIGDPFYDAGFNYNNGNTSFGANSLVNPTVSFGGQTGVRNTAFGVNVMPGLTIGQRNVGVGDMALFLNTSGTENTAIGSGAMYSNITGQYNVAVGRNAMTTNNSSYNTAVGFTALRNNASGVSNTAIGYEALRNTTGSGNIGVGYQAGRAETGSNRLYIENSNADANNALIYGEFDNDILRINGQLGVGIAPSAGNKVEVSGKTKTTNFQMTTGATANYILQSDASGNASWVAPNNTLSVMRTNLSIDQSLNTSGWQIINFNTVVFDLNAEFVGASNRFVAAKTGYYEVNAGYHTNDQSNMQFYSIGIFKNATGIAPFTPYQQTTGNHLNVGQVSRNVNGILFLTAGDYVEIYAENYQSGVTLDAYPAKTYFEVRQIR